MPELPRSYYCGLSEAWLCPHLRCGWLCGGLPDKRYKHYPYWIVYSCLSDRVLAPNQQLSFLDPPKIAWQYGNQIDNHREWWVAAIHCTRGVLWWVDREKVEFGREFIQVVRIDSKKKARLMNVAGLDPLKLDCKSEIPQLGKERTKKRGTKNRRADHAH